MAWLNLNTLLTLEHVLSKYQRTSFTLPRIYYHYAVPNFENAVQYNMILHTSLHWPMKWMTIWAYRRQPISRPNGRALECILWWCWRYSPGYKGTGLYVCIGVVPNIKCAYPNVTWVLNIAWVNEIILKGIGQWIHHLQNNKKHQ